MVLRLKVLRRQEQRINKVKEMMDNWYSIKMPSIPTYGYQPVGGSSVVSEKILTSGNNTAPADPAIQAAKGLFNMFGIDR